MIIFTTNNLASKNIAERLMDLGFKQTNNDRWEKDGEIMVDCKAPTVLEVPEYECDTMIVLSTHKSKNPKKILTAHIPGNWAANEAGGNESTLNIANCSKLKILFQEIKKEADKIGWNSCIEADHHGPTINTPIIFVEIGCTENEWNDEFAGKAIANAVEKSLKRNEKYQSAVGFGGGHYANEFSEIMIETEIAIGHICPKYMIDKIDSEMFRQSIEKNLEKVSKVIILKKETNILQKNKIIGFCENHSVDYELI